jgi:hypothetical protein
LGSRGAATVPILGREREWRWRALVEQLVHKRVAPQLLQSVSAPANAGSLLAE